MYINRYFPHLLPHYPQFSCGFSRSGVLYVTHDLGPESRGGRGRLRKMVEPLKIYGMYQL